MPTPAPDVAALDTGLHTPRRCRVQFPQALTTLDYRIPAQMSLAVGDLVIVPLGTKNRVAVVVALSEATDSPLPAAPNPEILYKTVQAKFEHLPPLSTQHLGYLDWLADYYLAPRGNAYRLAFPPKADFYAAIPPEITYTATSTAPDSLSVKQSTLYAEIIRQSGKATKAELLHHSQTSTVQLRALCDKGLIAPSNWKPSKPKQQLAPLSDAQNTALAQMLEDLGQNRAAVSLLDGETGSGKTEVYFHLIAIAIAQQKQVLISIALL
ncbi:MAG: DEAD/DEAH box helicase family protein [Alphaproteobacteria bacterium]|nr:DEAD/DEAH box helicase family protein [Alphaproteobacteria bacterium]